MISKRKICTYLNPLFLHLVHMVDQPPAFLDIRLSSRRERVSERKQVWEHSLTRLHIFNQVKPSLTRSLLFGWDMK